MDPEVRHEIAKDINKVEKTVKKANRKIGNIVIILMAIGFALLLALFAILGKFI
ncbi:hypothetical protein IH575_00885 [Candidatus Dojkabacteria bacterium]|nr:hypothetical protein [Candidatus Dojkabacteria bacterium]